MSAVTTWNKPARERHAHVGDALRNALSGVTKAAQDLALYLFEYCIDGRYEWFDLYDVALGNERRTAKREGRPYAKNTMREALKALVERGLVIIEKRSFGGMFRLTVSHPGPTRPFHEPIGILTAQSEFRQSDRNSDRIRLKARINSFPITEIEETAKQIAAVSDLLKREECTHSGSVASHGEKHRMHGSGSGRELIEEELDCLPDPDPARHLSPSLREENLEAHEILAKVEDAVGMTPQLRREVLNFTLAEIDQAISLLKEREASSEIKNPKGFVVEALRGRWRKENTETHRYPDELIRWYEWATTEGIVDGRPLSHCNSASTSSTSSEWLQVAVMIPKEERRPHDVVPYRFMLWREAMREYPKARQKPRTELKYDGEDAYEDRYAGKTSSD